MIHVLYTDSYRDDLHKTDLNETLQVELIDLYTVFSRLKELPITDGVLREAKCN